MRVSGALFCVAAKWVALAMIVRSSPSLVRCYYMYTTVLCMIWIMWWSCGCVKYNKSCVVVRCWRITLICNENCLYLIKYCCNFVKTLDIVTKYPTDGLPTLENHIIDTNIMKIGQAFTELRPKGLSCGVHIGFSGSMYFPECFHWFYQIIRSNERVYQVSHICLAECANLAPILTLPSPTIRSCVIT